MKNLRSLGMLPNLSLTLLFSLSLLCMLSIFPSGATAASPVLTINVDHAIRFDRRPTAGNIISFGSQESLLRGEIVMFRPSALTSHQHQTVFIPTEIHITQDQWTQLIELPVRGIIAATSPFDIHNEEILQHTLSHTSIPFPVYLLSQDGVDAKRLQETLNSLNSQEMAVISIGANARAVAPVLNSTMTNVHIYATLTLRPKEARVANAEVPRILFTAAFDTLGIAPSAKTTGGASGTAAALELWRRFNAEAALEAEATTDASYSNTNDSSSSSLLSPYSVSVLLGNTARFNYAGTRRWIAKREELDRYLLVLCLDELMLPSSSSGDDDSDKDDNTNQNSGTSLYMHVHDSFAKSPHYTKIKETAEAAAAKHGISLTILTAKTNYHHYDIHFEHEVLAHRQIPAVTFSSARTYRVDQIFRGGRVPVPPAVNITTPTTTTLLTRRVDFIYTFAQALLGRPHAPQAWIGSGAYMAGLLRHAAESPRSVVSTSSSSYNNNNNNNNMGMIKYAETLEAHMKERAAAVASRRALATSVSLATSRLTQPGVVLIGPYEQEMRVYVSKSTIVELFLLILTLIAVGGFAMLEFGFEKTWSIFIDSTEKEDPHNNNNNNNNNNNSVSTPTTINKNNKISN